MDFFNGKAPYWFFEKSVLLDKIYQMCIIA